MVFLLPGSPSGRLVRSQPCTSWKAKKFARNILAAGLAGTPGAGPTASATDRDVDAGKSAAAERTALFPRAHP